MKLSSILFIPSLFFSFTCCHQATSEKGFINTTNPPATSSLFKEVQVDSIHSPIEGVQLYNYNAAHVDSSYFINFNHATAKEREEHFGGVTPSEPNNIDIQYYQFKDAASGANWKKINDTLRYLVMGFSTEAKALHYNDSDFLMSIFTESVSMDLLEWTKDYISISQNTGGYYGGAHGLYGSSYYTFDIKSGDRLTYADLVSTESLHKLLEIVRKNYEKLYGRGYLDLSEKFELSNSFAFTKEGLRFIYNPYEMGSYVDGLREVIVPYSSLKGILNPAYKDLK